MKTRSPKEMIEKRISELKKWKTKILLEYLEGGDELQTMLAERNTMISLELNFLDSLLKKL